MATEEIGFIKAIFFPGTNKVTLYKTGIPHCMGSMFYTLLEVNCFVQCMIKNKVTNLSILLFHENKLSVIFLKHFVHDKLNISF